jgi:hypothetical protein
VLVSRTKASIFEDRDSRMTQQSEAVDGRDDAATDLVGHGIHESRQDAPSGARDDPRRACAIAPVPIWQPSLHLDDALLAWMLTDLARLESAFPAFSFAICSGWHGPRFEAWRDTTPSGLYAIITDDPDELWRELEMAPR